MNEIMPWVNSILLLVVAYLLDRKDKKQADEIVELKAAHALNVSSLKAEYTSDINKLYTLHHDNERHLADHRLKVAENHYPKQELDHRFAQLDITIKDGFRSLSTDFKEMTKALQDHLASAHHNGQ